MRFRLVFLFISLCGLLCAHPCNAQQPVTPDGRKLLRGLPLSFEANVGQTDPSYKFVFHSAGLGARFESSAAEFTLPDSNVHRHPIRLEFLGSADDAKITPEIPLPGKVNYLRGSDPSRWNRDISTFGSICYRSLYPGIDLRFYGNGEQVEHDFIVAPGSDPAVISVEVQTGGKVRLNADGDLLIETEHSVLRFQKPSAYQITEQGKTLVAANFHLHDSTFSFDLGAFDRSLPLVIDPILTYSTFLAGSQMDSIVGISVDAAGNAYVTGSTTSADFPTKSPYQASCAGTPCANIFITKFNPAGNALVFSTYVGGSNVDTSAGIAVDVNGNAIVIGSTNSSNFPTKNSYTTYSGFTNIYVFVLSLSADGSALNYSSLLGQINILPQLFAVAVDHQGSAYVTSQTDDVLFPITKGTIGTSVPGYPFNAMFVTKLLSNGSIGYSTVIPGTLPQNPGSNANDFAPASIAIDTNHAAYIGGISGPGLPTTLGVLGPDFPGDATDPALFFGYALKLNADASKIDYATYFPAADFVNAVALGTGGTLYVGGQTFSAAFATTSGAYQAHCPPGQNVPCSAGFIAQLNAAASQYLGATYLSGTPTQGNEGTSVQSIAVGPEGKLWVGGLTASADFPLKNPVVGIFPQDQNAGFVSELNDGLTALSFSTFLSGQNNPSFIAPGLFVQAGGAGIVFAAGSTADLTFPTTQGSFEPAPPNTFGAQHGFVTKIDTTVASATSCPSPLSLNFGTWLINTPSPSQFVTLQNCGNAALQVESVVSSNPDFTQTNTCASPVAPGLFCQISVTFTPSSVFEEFATLTITDNASVSTQSISVSGQGGQPQIFLPSSLNAGDALVGTSISPQSALAFLFNTGNGNLIVNSITVTGDFSYQNQCNTPTAPFNFCFILITFTPTAPGTRTGVLTISDNAPGSPQIIQLSGNGLTSYPSPSIATIQAIPVSPTGGTLEIVGNFFFPASVALWHGSPRPALYIDENDLFVTLTAADLAQIGQIDVRVVNPSPGGGTSMPAPATVYLSIPQTTGDVKYDSTKGLLYATVPASAATNPNSLLVLSPQTGDIIKTIPFHNNPDRLALSDDNTVLYIGLDRTGQVIKLSTQSWKVLETIQLPRDSFAGQEIAQNMAVIPGTSDSVVISLAFTTQFPQSAGVIVYDGSKPRPNTIPQWIDFPNISADSISFLGSDAGILYGSDVEVGSSFYRFNLNASGITLKDATSTFGGGILTNDGIFFYEGNGNVVNPKIPSVVQTYNTSDGGFWSAVTPDLQRQSIYASEPNVNPYPAFFFDTLFSRANLKTLSPLESIYFPFLAEAVQNIVPCGQSCIAMRVAASPFSAQPLPNSNDAIVLFNDGPVKPGIVNITAADPVVSFDKIAGTYTIKLTLSNTGDLAATGVQVAQATLNAVGGEPVNTLTPLPISTNLAPGGSTHISLSFPSSVGALGSKVVLTLMNEPFSFALPGGTVESGIWGTSLRFVLQP
jgi:Beta-propeller repeat